MTTTDLPRTETGRLCFPKISHTAFQHPNDLRASIALRKVPALDIVVRQISKHFFERVYHVETVGQMLEISPRQLPRLYKLVEEAGNILDINPLPRVFLETSYRVNATTFGIENYTITLNSGLVDLLNEDEILAIIGHEMAHIKCEHVLYRTVATLLEYASGRVLTGFLGLGRLALAPLRLALLAWSRQAELSCDRGALLVTQDITPVATALAKLAGATRSVMGEIDLEEIYAQGARYENEMDEEAITWMAKYFREVQMTHPVPVWRAKVITDWAKSDQYGSIISGDYQRDPKLVSAG